MILKLPHSDPSVQSGLRAPELKEASTDEQVCVQRSEGWDGTRPLRPAGNPEGLHAQVVSTNVGMGGS